MSSRNISLSKFDDTMNVSRILDYHQMVLMSENLKCYGDKTSCGLLCQHPGCWESNRRQERGILETVVHKPPEEDDYFELPVQSHYNMIEDYGISSAACNKALQVNCGLQKDVSTKKKLSQPWKCKRFSLPKSPFITSVKDTASLASQQTQGTIHTMEVQEVFDKDDLNSKWDDTFMTKKIFVWVPNTYKNTRHRAFVDPTQKQGQQTLSPQDLTETMVPLQVELQREESISKKSVQSSLPPYRQGISHKAPMWSAKPDADFERNKTHGIIERGQEISSSLSTGINKNFFAFHSSSGEMYTSDALLQKKMPLHYKQPSIREFHHVDQKPVFQLDFEDKSISVKNQKESFFDSTHGINSAQRKQRLSLQNLASESSKKKSLRQLPSVSLGLPELPSCLGHRRAFVYNKKNRPDFTLVPVPTLPASVRSSECSSRDYDSTLYVNLPSVTDLHDEDFYPHRQTAQHSPDRYTPNAENRGLRKNGILSLDKKVIFVEAGITTGASADDLYSGTVEEGNVNNSNIHQELPQHPSSPQSVSEWPQVTKSLSKSPMEVATSLAKANSCDKHGQKDCSDLSGQESEKSFTVAGKNLKAKGESPAPPPPSPETVDKSGPRASHQHNSSWNATDTDQSLQEQPKEEESSY